MPPRADSDLTIGEAARLSGVRPSTLRYWEDAGLLAAPERVGGKRRYDAGSLREISLIVLAKRAGLTLSDTRAVLSALSGDAPPPRIWQEMAARRLPQIRETLARTMALERMLEAGLRCECASLEECLAAHDQEPALTA